MKAMRTLFAALAIAMFAAACNATDITEPPTDIQQGQMGSGMG